ncbi:MAG: DNA double-strand break repair protein Mre11 [Haloarculaceae archaeon]
MARVIHTGDTHLGYRQYHEPERQRDFLTAFEQVATDGVEDDVDAVVHAGDLFHDRRPTLDDVMGALTVLRRLADAHVPFLAIVGNHESRREAQWLDLYESLGLATRLGASPVTLGNTAFYGLDFLPRSKREDFEYDFEDHDADFAALVGHGLFEPFPHGDWDLRAVLEAADVRFDAVLLGDDHQPRTRRVTEPHEAWVTYCGSTERASAAEREERGYNLVEFDTEPGVDVRRRGLDTRDFVYVDVDLGPGEGPDRVRETVGQYDVEDAVVVVTITGEGEPVPPAAIEEFGDDQGALVTRVTDHREVGAEADALDVSFADPDAAVEERIREMGLSSAAQDVDEVVRASDVSDTNVDDRVEERVQGLVQDGGVDEFEPAPPEAEPAKVAEDTEAESEAGADREAEGEPETDVPREADTDSAIEADSEGDAETEAEEQVAQDEQVSEADPDGSGEQVTDRGGRAADGEAAEDATGASEGQASMEEYL